MQYYNILKQYMIYNIVWGIDSLLIQDYSVFQNALAEKMNSLAKSKDKVNQKFKYLVYNLEL